MIEKERLEELIKAEETIYTGDSDVHLLSRWHFVCDGKLCESHRYESEYLYDLEELFETEEEAEFALKYQNITRTETLDLPTWEEIENDYIEPNIILFHRFMKKDNTEAELVVDCFDNKIEVLGVGGAYNIWEATKANYLEACELCRKLFLGEYELDKIEGETE